VWGCLRGRQNLLSRVRGETERQRDRETKRQRDRDTATQRQRHRGTETERQREPERVRERCDSYRKREEGIEGRERKSQAEPSYVACFSSPLFLSGILLAEITLNSTLDTNC
jgi:hypothetical protein